MCMTAFKCGSVGTDPVCIMRLTNFIGALFAALFSRRSVVLIFWLITIPVCIQAMYRSSFTVGASALAACALCYIGAYGFTGSLLARREKDDRAFDRVAIGAIALVVMAAGSVLMIWSGEKRTQPSEASTCPPKRSDERSDCCFVLRAAWPAQVQAF